MKKFQVKQEAKKSLAALNLFTVYRNPRIGDFAFYERTVLYVRYVQHINVFADGVLHIFK